jgi:hypothetical protein
MNLHGSINSKRPIKIVGGMVMKKYIITMLCLVADMHMQACPTCVGRIEKDSPAFFHEDFYQPTPPPSITEPQTQDEELSEKEMV